MFHEGFGYLLLRFFVSFQGQSIGVNPLYMMVPATVCASFAFMLPVATPPNAIVFGTGRLTVADMVSNFQFIIDSP